MLMPKMNLRNVDLKPYHVATILSNNLIGQLTRDHVISKCVVVFLIVSFEKKAFYIFFHQMCFREST
jgi:hypothetical protein